MGKPELQLQYLDEWMIRWKKFQTEEDWNIEKSRQRKRKFNFCFSGLVAGALTLYSSGDATIKRQFGPPHFFDIGIDAKIKQCVVDTMTSRPRYTPQGYGRLLLVGLPTYITFVCMEHWAERNRLRKYLRQNTVFGEQARRLVNTGKIEEYLPVNIKATLPQAESARVYS